MCSALCPYFGVYERAGCLTLFVFLMPDDCYSSLADPHDAVDWSVVCECGNS